MISLKNIILFWKGRKKGIVHTQDITWNHIRAIFFPKDFHEKYRYLGCVPYGEQKTMLHALVLIMDREAKPWWCPRWFLRFLHLFGSDNSIVRVRNRFLHNLENKITKGILMYDYKTKWNDYDLRISIVAPSHIQELAEAIESYTYKKGYREDLIQQIANFKPDVKTSNLTMRELEDIYTEIYLPQTKEKEDLESSF